MFFTKRALRFIAVTLSLLLWVTAVPRAAFAEVVTTEALLREEGINRGLAQSKIHSFLERQEVQLAFSRYGVSAAEAQARVESLSPSELAQLASAIESAPAGGDGLSTVIVAVVAVFLILLLTDILGLTKVFPFTRSAVRR